MTVPNDGSGTAPAAGTGETYVAPLRAAIERVVTALRTLLNDSVFVPDPYAGFAGRRTRVATEAAPGAPALPSTGRPIRGAKGVTTRVSSTEPPFGTRPPTISSVLTDALRSGPRTAGGQPAPEPLQAPWTEMRAAVREWVNAAFFTPILGRRVYEAYGFKYYDVPELDARVAEVAMGGMHETLAEVMLEAMLESALTALGFRLEAPAEFTAWDAVVTDVDAALGRLAARDVHRYRVRALLNGPLVDQDEPLVLAALADWTDTVLQGPITLEPATDRLLEEMTSEYEHRVLAPAVERSNAVLSFTVGRAVDESVERYRELYPLAANVVTCIVDVLRLLTPDDIGVAYLTTREVEPFTPDIPLNYAWEYQPQYAVDVPRRLAFHPPSLPAFSDTQRTEAERLILARFELPEVKGLGVMLRRFRDSYERYDARDPERLLDLAISLEAVFLNDNDSKEQLSFRLALRIARLLGGSLAERKVLFRRVRDLYTIRSKVAHGETVGTLSGRNKRTLEELQVSIPPLVRRALVLLLDGGGPSGLTDEALRDWWLNLELGGVAESPTPAARSDDSPGPET